MQRVNLSDDLAAYIHPCSAFVVNRLFISAYAISDRGTYIDASGIKPEFVTNLRNIFKKKHSTILLNLISYYILQKVLKSDLGEVVILDADNNTIESPFQDLESLPQDVVRKTIYRYHIIR